MNTVLYKKFLDLNIFDYPFYVTIRGSNLNAVTFLAKKQQIQQKTNTFLDMSRQCCTNVKDVIVTSKK